MSKKKTDVDSEGISFEQSLAELEQLVGKLEGGKLPLADALAAYELGVKRLGSCYEMLRGAERRIELVRAVSAQGVIDAESFEDGGETDLTEKSAARSQRRTAKPANRGRIADDDGGLF